MAATRPTTGVTIAALQLQSPSTRRLSSVLLLQHHQLSTPANQQTSPPHSPEVLLHTSVSGSRRLQELQATAVLEARSSVTQVTSLAFRLGSCPQLGLGRSS